MHKTLVYNPSVRVEIISGDKVYDVSRDVVRGNVNRLVNTTSHINITLANKNLKYNNAFKRMDRIQVYLKRVKWTKVFTGYLDSVPVFQLYPGTVDLRASCTIKRLVHTWWDPNLTLSKNLFDQQLADEQVAEITGIERNTSDEEENFSMAFTPDAGLGEMLRRILNFVGNWNDNDIFIQDVPTSFVDYLAENLEKYDGSKETEEFKRLFGYDESIGTGSGGGGLSEASFTTIGPPANGEAYSMDEIVAIVHGAGWRGDDVVIGASIIMAESTGNPAAINPNNPNGTIDRGLWQINSIHEWRLNPGENWFDPAVSTRLARDIYADAGDSWQPWSTLSYWGTNTQYMEAARASVNKGIQPVPGNDGSTEVPGNNRPLSMHNQSGKDNEKGKEDDKTNKKDKEGDLPGGESAANPSPAPPVKITGNEYMEMIGGEAPNTSQMTIADSIAAVALYKFPMMTYWSGERYTDNGFHSTLQAADISNGGSAGTPEMKQLAQWWFDNFFGKGLLELIHHPFAHNVLSDTDYGTGREGPGNGYSDGVLEQHRDHVHIAMDGVVSADGTTTGVSASAGAGGITFENKLGKSLFDYIFAPTDLDQSGISDMFTGEKAPANDEPLIKTIRSVSDAAMRSFQSTPDGGIAFFYPDYWGMDAIDGEDAVLKLEDIELKEFHINANDDAFTTHVYVRGNPTFARGWGAGDGGEYGLLQTRGVATVENEWLFTRLLDMAVVAPEFETVEDIYGRYGVRPLLDSGRASIMTPQMELLSAAKLFLQKWSEQYSTRVDLTFMPELFPGMRIELVSHNVAVYVEQVSHHFDFTSGGGFSTSASVTAPHAPVGSATRIDGSEKSEAHKSWITKIGESPSTDVTGRS